MSLDLPKWIRDTRMRMKIDELADQLEKLQASEKPKDLAQQLKSMKLPENPYKEMKAGNLSYNGRFSCQKKRIEHKKRRLALRSQDQQLPFRFHFSRRD